MRQAKCEKFFVHDSRMTCFFEKCVFFFWCFVFSAVKRLSLRKRGAVARGKRRSRTLSLSQCSTRNKNDVVMFYNLDLAVYTLCIPYVLLYFYIILSLWNIYTFIHIYNNLYIRWCLWLCIFTYQDSHVNVLINNHNIVLFYVSMIV